MIIPAGYAQANFRMSGGAVPTGAECTLGLEIDVFGGDPDDLAALLAPHWVARIMGNLTDAIQLDDVLVKYGPNTTGPSGVAPDGTAGSYGTASVPPNTSLLVHKLTGFGGRQGQGRMFIPGFREDHVSTGGLVDSGDVSSIQTALDNLHADIVSEGVLPALLRSAGSPISAPVPIIRFTLDSRVSTQRRRLRR